MAHRRVGVVTWLAWLTLIAAGILLIIGAYWYLYPYKPVTVHYAKVLESSKTVRQGGTLLVKLRYTKPDNIAGIGTRSFVDGIIYATPPTAGNLPAGTFTIIRAIPVPKELPPGTYHVHTNLQFEVNPIRTVNYSYDTDEFEVIAK